MDVSPRALGALCIRPEIAKRAGRVALVVGSLLALINRPDLLFGWRR